MNIKFENLELIPQIKDLLIKANSPYLSKKELSNYMKVSESFIKQKLYNGEFEENKHFFKIGDAKIIFDRLEIDGWIRAYAKQGEKNGKPISKERKALHKHISQWAKNQSSNRA